MARVINFSAGPATLPLPALEYAHNEFLDHEGTGMSLIEHSHRGAAYAKVHEEAKALFRELLDIPDTHEVLFMQGGATGQFALAPMNLRGPGQSADYIMTGAWSDKALAEAKITGEAREAGTGKVDGKYTRVPKQADLDLDANAAYLHFTTNNTIMGTQFHEYPDSGSVPLVADMSSDILWRPIDVSKFGLIYAGAQKNLGPSGITVLILRKDLAERSPKTIPKIFRYKTILDGDSLQNTIPTFPVYMVRNVLRWVRDQGGAAAMEKRNRNKAGYIYDMIDQNPGFFHCPVEVDSRSMMNPVFRLPTEDLEKKFIADAAKAGMVGIKGHRSVGGIRASIYNAMEPSDVQTFVDFAKSFAQTNA
ncbi:MAG: 3-phosphoserine/phosphohydroxythreonine transaminase [Deltaproteobacteria bacterium]|nr:3-phosphoserine/phosphohydroxythreonine transaminase [Deltaproteobacteria bacterium]MBW1874904.1 3-phosphoserine/phosphohydroxythreonine transaminase [Deltaproteobacteria bacterium]MBW2209561.1 3-phosphoserine/phosphohydroxythreonine transaminase [Deltaproteobacteria bacterium]MBW2378898.1 3-phosphoserine/phosphohydroxythreonine transaminase [Deltaproteobacteria bacterium]MBW2549756.1 3-phosphoserine/phosphohydroxythreonine transaminase [Deltaproteobacteria bacterium]